jgi:hypothetical protein
MWRQIALEETHLDKLTRLLKVSAASVRWKAILFHIDFCCEQQRQRSPQTITSPIPQLTYFLLKQICFVQKQNKRSVLEPFGIADVIKERQRLEHTILFALTKCLVIL